ncbi:MAG: TonB-dependent receptor [Cyclobacteriaceae bacterium]
MNKSRHRILIIYAFISLFAALGTVNAQEPSREELASLSLEQLMNLEVISASKTAEKLTDAPGIIQVITSEEINRFGALNLAEVLDKVTGAYNMGSFTYPQNVTSIRGDLANDFDTHVLLLMNGRPMRESVYGGYNSSIYLGFPISIVERIEVIRGPGSVLYGSNAYSGVVNIITKKAEQTSGSAKLTIGSFETFDATGDFSVVKDDLVVTGAFKSYNEEGWEFTATDLVGDTRTIDYLEKNKSFALTTSYKNLSVNTIHTESEQRVFSIAVPIWTLTSNPENKRFKSSRTMVDIGYDLEFSDQLNTDVNLTYNGFGLEFYTGPDVTFDLNRDGSRDWLFEVSNYYRPTDKLNVLFGGTAYKQSGQLGANIEKYNNVWYSAYAQVDYLLIDQVKLIAGGQFNSIEGLDNDFVPRFGAIFNATDKLGAKVLWSQSYRAPYAIETKIDAPGFQVGNPDLNAEKLTNLDIQLFFTTNKFELYATYFDYISDNLITPARLDPTGADPTGSFINNPEGLKGSGFSVETKYVPNENILLTGSFSHQENSLEVRGTQVNNFTYSPNDILKIGLSYQTSDKAFNIGLYNSYLSAFNNDRSDLTPTAPVNGELSSVNLLSVNMNLNLTKVFNAKMKEDVIFSLYSTNVLGEELNVPDFKTGRINSLPGRPGAALYGSLAIKF